MEPEMWAQGMWRGTTTGLSGGKTLPNHGNLNITSISYTFFRSIKL